MLRFSPHRQTDHSTRSPSPLPSSSFRRNLSLPLDRPRPRHPRTRRAFPASIVTRTASNFVVPGEPPVPHLWLRTQALGQFSAVSCPSRWTGGASSFDTSGSPRYAGQALQPASPAPPRSGRAFPSVRRDSSPRRAVYPDAPASGLPPKRTDLSRTVCAHPVHFTGGKHEAALEVHGT